MAIQMSSLIYEYQQVLLGKTKTGRVANELWEDNEIYNHEIAVQFLKEYIIEKLLKWTPREMYAKFDEDIVSRLYLKPILAKIIIPTEATRTDYFVYAHVLYPDVISFDFLSMTIKMYNRVLAGVVKRYPRGFFSDHQGRERAIICLRYVLEQKNAFADLENMYRQFTGENSKKLIENHKLTLALDYQFDTPLQYLDAALYPNERDEFLMTFYMLWDTLPFSKDIKIP